MCGAVVLSVQCLCVWSCGGVVVWSCGGGAVVLGVQCSVCSVQCSV